jgi:hypothetical protein
MVVRTLGCGREVSGLYIGARNAQRHFPRDQRHIELHLGHLRIHCELMPEFWNGKPEISDSRLGDWLFSRICHGRTQRAPSPIEMIPAGKDAYRIVPFAIPPASTNGLSKIGPPPAVMHADKKQAAEPERHRTHLDRPHASAAQRLVGAK